MNFIAAEIIKKKRNRLPLSDDEILWFIDSYTKEKLPDYQMSALLMAIYFQGMTSGETTSLMRAMLNSGVVLNFQNLPFPKVDKHSTGGVGDKTSLILGPIVAAAGAAVPMISGRGLGHTGGTLDKLESIPGFNTQLSLEQFRHAVEKHRICFLGQTKEICPADKKIYALRDVTGTVESLPLICASIMSKKLAEGIDSLVLDVKFGSGAFMKTKEKSEELARGLMSIAENAGKKVSAFLTNMDQPLGRFAGNSLEIEECLQIMRGEKVAEDTKILSLKLAAKMLVLSGVSKNDEDAFSLAEKTLDSGKAYEKFEELCRLHGGRLSDLPKPKYKIDVLSSESGFIEKMQTEQIGVIGIKIKAGRAVATDVIEPTAGIEFHSKVGDPVQKGQPLFSLYGADRSKLEAVQSELYSTLVISKSNIPKPQLIWKVL